MSATEKPADCDVIIIPMPDEDWDLINRFWPPICEEDGASAIMRRQQETIDRLQKQVKRLKAKLKELELRVGI